MKRRNRETGRDKMKRKTFIQYICTIFKDKAMGGLAMYRAIVTPI